MNCSLVYLEKSVAPLTLDLEISLELLASRTLIHLCCFQFFTIEDVCCGFVIYGFYSVQFSLSAMSDSVTPWTAARQASLSITNSQSLLKLMSIESVMPSNQLILYRPLLLLFSIFPSIRVFSSESVLHIRWPKYWSFSFSISPSSEYSGLISFRIDWLDLFAGSKITVNCDCSMKLKELRSLEVKL